MKENLTIPLVLCCGLSLDASQAQTSDEPLEEMFVTGEFAGPDMWEVTHPGHPGQQHGYLETLRQRGQEVLAPGVDRP